MRTTVPFPSAPFPSPPHHHEPPSPSRLTTSANHDAASGNATVDAAATFQLSTRLIAPSRFSHQPIRMICRSSSLAVSFPPPLYLSLALIRSRTQWGTVFGLLTREQTKPIHHHGQTSGNRKRGMMMCDSEDRESLNVMDSSVSAVQRGLMKATFFSRADGPPRKHCLPSQLSFLCHCRAAPSRSRAMGGSPDRLTRCAPNMSDETANGDCRERWQCHQSSAPRACGKGNVVVEPSVDGVKSTLHGEVVSDFGIGENKRRYFASDNGV